MRRVVAVMAFAVVVAGAGCRPNTVRIVYDPVPGAVSRYDIELRTETVLSLEGQGSSRRTSRAALRVEQRVLGRDRRVEVRVERPGSPPRRFVARLDHAARVREIESVEGLPASVLGDLGLPELFPGAVGVLPERALRPGERWRIDERVRMPGGEPTSLRGHGRLVELGVYDGAETAVVRSTTTIDVRRSTAGPEGRIELDGEQVSDTTTRHVLADGAVSWARATTTGTFDVTLAPPAGTTASPLDGTLRVTVHSEVRRRP